MSAAAQPVEYDLIIIGGGINGCGIARDAAGRGLKVLLLERDDLAGATSSASSKLIHGGLRYLEQYEFRLVREALAERALLLRNAPHLVHPLTFILPHVEGMRPAWMIRAGLWLYDWLGGPSPLPRSSAISLRDSSYGSALRPEFERGFRYADCWVDDARLVVENAKAAAQRGATILTRTACVLAARDAAGWSVTARSSVDGEQSEFRARALINAAGPWAQEVLQRVLNTASPARLQLVKGSHIVVPRLYQGDHAYILQNQDRRVVFAIPYEQRFTLVGTTEAPQSQPAAVSISPEETEYLCRAVSRYFAQPLSPSAVVWSYAGIRPLYDDGGSNVSQVTRDYVLQLDGAPNAAPVLSIFGGKITTYRRLAERALESLRAYFPAMGPCWTASAMLPGGDLPGADLSQFTAQLASQRPGIPLEALAGMVRRYGALIGQVLGDATSLADMGGHFGAGLTEREIDYLVEREWAAGADDILWRRTKCGLHMSLEQRAAVAAYFKTNHCNNLR